MLPRESKRLLCILAVSHQTSKKVCARVTCITVKRFLYEENEIIAKNLTNFSTSNNSRFEKQFNVKALSIMKQLFTEEIHDST